MNKKLYKQTDKRWSNLAYPTDSSSFGGNGCGACSVLHCIIEREQYKNWTPKDIQPYMKKHAKAGNGTLWSGIEAGLKHFGMENVRWFKQDACMADVFKELNKKNRIGVILFSAGCGPDGTVWTSGGHYIAFTDYKYEKSKHWFYMKDSGDRDHDGWYAYETSMMGRVPQIWSCTVPKEKTEEEPKKEKPLSEKIAAKAKKLAWAKGTNKAKYKYKGGKPTSAFKKALNKYYPTRSSWGAAPKVGASCDVYVGTVARACGISKYPRGLNQQLKFKSSKFKEHTGEKVTPYSIIKSLGLDGTYIVMYKTSAKKAHTLIYSNKIIYEASYTKTYGHVNTSLSKLKKKRPEVRILEFK